MPNTRITLGDIETVDALVANTLITLEESEISYLGSFALYNKTTLKRIKFPNVTSIKNSALQGCAGLTEIESQDMPLLESISANGFEGCSNLTRIELPSLSNIEGYAFSNCGNLEELETGENIVTFNGVNTFNACMKFKSLILNCSDVPELPNNSVFKGCPISAREGAIFVPDELYNDYIQDALWSNYLIMKKSDYPVTDFSTITDSWEQIISAENNGSYLTKYKIGDTKMLHLNGEEYYAQIIGFDKETKSNSSGKAHITWMLTKMFEMSYISNTGEVMNGWKDCFLRNHLNEDILPTMDIASYIVEVKKSSNKVINSVESNEYVSDYLWIPSYYEVTGNTTHGNYGYFYSDVFASDDASTRIKVDKSYIPSPWWLRTATNETRCHYVMSGGGTNLTGTESGTALGIIIFFCT